VVEYTYRDQVTETSQDCTHETRNREMTFDSELRISDSGCLYDQRDFHKPKAKNRRKTSRTAKI
jgi:hypothetical protein